jgi:hypothetical protein
MVKAPSKCVLEVLGFEILAFNALIKQEGHDGPGSLTWHNRIQAMS